MAVAVVDTAVLVGMADSQDTHHEAAMEIVRGMDRGELPIGCVTNYVVLETLNWIHRKRHHRLAGETYDRLSESAGFEIQHAAQKDYVRGLELFETYEGLSFGDASIVAYMEREEVEFMYSFDDDFDAVDGITRLESPDNPYR
ncbi:type II toxin-antitoxin system VapC family toxin [Halovivax cerinus]|uniref:Type II toxin-antitoxin system VapC family toxin n=1 Tax=Halovivax cerinus TaxID=1487865 RepID=A0ABD5NKJ3_9EURY|nr:PIN domain-containing protein [Halovivax cerinus]